MSIVVSAEIHSVWQPGQALQNDRSERRRSDDRRNQAGKVFPTEKSFPIRVRKRSQLPNFQVQLELNAESVLNLRADGIDDAQNVVGRAIRFRHNEVDVAVAKSGPTHLSPF